MKFGIASLPARAGQLSVAAAIMPASSFRDLPRERLGDLVFVMWGIGVSSVSDRAATRFWRELYRKARCQRHGFDQTRRRTRTVAVMAMRCKPRSTKEA
jgi:adenylylsulfate kinase-like enzyme